MINLKKLKRNKRVAGFFPLLILIILLSGKLFADNYYSLQSKYGNYYSQLKGFRDIANPHTKTPDSDGLITITYTYKNNPYIYGFPTKIGVYYPPFEERSSGVFFLNIDAKIGFCIKYKNIPICYNPPDINSAEGWDVATTVIFPDNFLNDEIYYKNSSGGISLYGISKKIPDEIDSGWLFLNEIYSENDGIGISKFEFSSKVKYDEFKNWYDNIKEPLNPDNSSFYYANCVDSAHPEQYTRHICSEEECDNIEGFKSQKYKPATWYYYTKNGDSSGKKYFYCWVPAGNYSDNSIIWDIWTSSIYFPTTIRYQCSPSNLQYCKTQEECESIGQGYWYDGKCNALSKEDKCLEDITYCDNESLCDYYRNNKPDNAAYWDNTTNKCTFNCSSNHLDMCDNQTACEEAGGYWYYNYEDKKDECNALSKEDKCLEDITYCDNESLCDYYRNNKPDNAAYWDNTTNKCTFNCSSNHLDMCDNQTACEEAGGYWYPSGICTNLSLECANDPTKCPSQEMCELNYDYQWYYGKCEYKCSNYHLESCHDSVSCSANGGVWTGSVCNPKPKECNTGILFMANLTGNKSLCLQYNCEWVNNQCVMPGSGSTSIPEECLNNPTNCTVQSFCEGANYVWKDGKCYFPCSREHLELCDENSCIENGGFWNGSQCIDNVLNNWEIDNDYLQINVESKCNDNKLGADEFLMFNINYRSLYGYYLIPIFGVVYSDGNSEFYYIDRNNNFYRINTWETNEFNINNEFKLPDKIIGSNDNDWKTINIFDGVFTNGMIKVCDNQVEFETKFKEKLSQQNFYLDNISQLLFGAIVIDNTFTINGFLTNNKLIKNENIQELPIKENALFGWKYRLLGIDCSYISQECDNGSNESNNNFTFGNLSSEEGNMNFIKYEIDNTTLKFDLNNINQYNTLLLGYLEEKNGENKVYFNICKDGSVGLIGNYEQFQEYLNRNIYLDNCINNTGNNIELSQENMKNALESLCNEYNIKILEYYFNKKLFKITDLLNMYLNSNGYYFYYRETDFCNLLR